MDMTYIAKQVTPDDIEDVISYCYYVTGYEALRHDYYVNDEPREDLKSMTLCILVLANGFTVVGKSACIDPEAFDAEKGREMAYADARRQIYPLLGFLLKTDMREEALEEEIAMALAEAMNLDRA